MVFPPCFRVAIPAPRHRLLFPLYFTSNPPACSLMNWKFTLVLVAIVAALYLFFTYYENKLPTPPAPGELAHVVSLDRNQIDALTITDHDQKIELTRGADNKWLMKSPVADRADQDLIDQVMTNLEILRKEDTLSGKDVGKGKLADFGLQTPRERLVVTAHGGHTTEFLFGNETVLDGKTYLQLAGVDDIYVVGDELKKLLGKDVNAWRDHHLTNIAATDVTKLVLKNPTGEIELQRDGQHWKLLKPLMARADDAKINDTISQITNAQISSFIADDKADAASYGLAEPKGTITLFTEKDPKGIELLVGNAPAEPKATPTPAASPTLPEPSPANEKAAATVYARMPSRQSIYTIPNTIVPLLELKPAELRDHSIVRVNEDTVDRVRVSPAGEAPFTLGHKNKGWTILEGAAANQPADAMLSEKLMSLLTGPNVSEFVSDSAADLGKYGLDKPVLQVKLSSYASENTAESNAGEKPLATVSFGKSTDSVVYVRVEDEPFVVSVPKALLDDIPLNSIQWQPTTIFQADPTKVGSLEITVPDHPVLALTRPDKGTWTASGKTEGALNTAKVDPAVNTLAHLHATRWLGPVKPEYALDKPVFTVKFSGGTDPKNSGRLVLGGTDPSGITYAQVDGKPGAFLISRPDRDTLVTDYLPGMAPVAPAGTPAAPDGTPTATPAPVPPATPAPVPAAPVAPAAPPMTLPPLVPTPTPAPSATPVPIPTAPEPTPAATPTPAPTPEPTPVPAMPPPESTVAPTPIPVSTPADVPAPAASPESYL